MISFKNDYSEGALPTVLQRLVETNLEKTVGYGDDEYTRAGKEAVKKVLECGDCSVQFLVGGTQTNLLTIAHSLNSYEAVIAVETGHIATSEAGAIEATGHKIIEVKNYGDGKIKLDDVKKAFELHKNNFHKIQPKMLYISNPTELGTLYTKAELEALYEYCKEVGLYLYIDGARLAYAIASEKNDIKLTDYKELCDVIYLGGTKCGLLFGEALVVFNENISQGLIYSVKQKGALLAKGRLLGIQFEELMRDNNYFNVGVHGNKMASMLKKGVLETGHKILVDSYTNQQFFIFNNEVIERLKERYLFEICSKSEKETVVRFVTSWSTKEEEVMDFIEFLKTL